MKTVQAKLKSKSGASITFALLLFLVCAVVSSIVIVAGTTASGRLSKMAEMDQRYYSVTSAAKLLIDLIDGESVTVEIEREETYDKDHTFEKAVLSKFVLNDSGANPIETATKEGTNAFGPLTKTEQYFSLPFLERVACDLVPLPVDSGASPVDNSIPVIINMKIKDGPNELESLQITMTKKEYSDGTLEFEIKNSTGDPYTLGLVFKMKKSTMIKPQENRFESNKKIETKRTDTTMKWTLSDIDTINMLR